MSANSLFLNRPIPVERIKLGRLVLYPKYPDHHFIQPSLDEASAAPSQEPDGSSSAPDVVTQKFQDINEILERARGTRLELNLLNLLSFSVSKPMKTPSASTTSIKSPLCIVRQLCNAEAYFAAACQQPDIRRWLEQNSYGLRSHIYMVCGIRTLVDARVEQTSKREAELNVSVNIPASLITTATGVPLVAPVTDLGLGGGGVSFNRASNETASYTAAGEQVFAVQYRKVRTSMFSSKRVDKAHLEKGNWWHRCLESAIVEEGFPIDSLEAELAGALATSDLRGQFENLALEDEEILFRIDD